MRSQIFKRYFLVTLVAATVVSVISGPRVAIALPNSPFTVGDFDYLDNCGASPILDLAIANHGSVPSSQYTLWRNATLNITYLEADGVTYYPIDPIPLPNIPAGSEQTLKIPVHRADITFKIAIVATSVTTQKPFLLLKLTSLTPTFTVCAPKYVPPAAVHPTGGAPAPAPVPGTTKYLTLDTSELRTYSRQVVQGGGSGGSFDRNEACSNDCTFADVWAGNSFINEQSAGSSFDVGAYNSALAGYVHDNKTHPIKDTKLTEYFRTAFRFDISSTKGKPIRSATLELHGQRTMYNYKPSSVVLCGTQLAPAQDQWWTNNQDPLDKANFSSPVAVNAVYSNKVVVDVTAIVQNWVKNPSTNDGFILRNPDENVDAFLQTSCVTQYNFIALNLLVAN